MQLTEQTCRFCLSSCETEMEPLLCRLSPTLVTDLLQGVLCIQVTETDQFVRMCLECEKKLKQMYKLLCEFRDSDRHFRILLNEYKLSVRQTHNKPEIEMVYIEGVEIGHMLQADLIEDSKPDSVEKQQQSAPAVKKERTPSPESNPPEDFYEADFSFVDPPSSPDADINSGDEDGNDYTFGEDQELGKALIGDEGMSDAESVEGDRKRKKLPKTQSNNAKCFICSHTEDTEKLLMKHLKQHQNMLPYKCPQCLTKLNDLFDVNYHNQLHEFPSGCLYCESIFSEQNELQEHSKTCNGYSCKRCNRNYKTVEIFKLHKCAHKVTSLKALNAFLSRLETRQKLGPHFKNCPSCDQKFAKNNQLAEHLLSVHAHLSVPMFSCDLCTMHWTSLEAARRHRISHKETLPAQKIKNTLSLKVDENVCWVCSLRCENDSKLVAHFESEHPEHVASLFSCEQCDRKFSNVARKERHVSKVHKKNNEARYCCTFCGKNFNRSQNLNDHENSHRGVSAYHCEACGKEFAFKEKYSKHIRTCHSDDFQRKKHECQLCGKVYSDRSGLIYHMRTHSGERPYECSLCQQRFITNQALKFHRNLHHKDEQAAEQTRVLPECSISQSSASNYYTPHNAALDANISMLPQAAGLVQHPYIFPFR